MKGAVIVFTGILSRLVLKVRLSATRWAGIALVIAGLAVVGITDTFLVGGEDEDGMSNATSIHSQNLNMSTSDILLGDALILVMQGSNSAQNFLNFLS